MMHRWGDDWSHWDDLYKAEAVIGFWGKRVGRIPGQLKEKYGEIRFYASIGRPTQLHDIIKSGHYYYRWSPNKHPILCFIDKLSKAYVPLIGPIYERYQKFMYGFAYHRACKKYPHVRKEILFCADHDDLLFKSEKKFMDQCRAEEIDDEQA